MDIGSESTTYMFISDPKNDCLPLYLGAVIVIQLKDQMNFAMEINHVAFFGK
jgi:hypothetical protein